MKNHKDILTLYLKKYLYKKDGAVRRVRTGGLRFWQPDALPTELVPLLEANIPFKDVPFKMKFT
tara:strand:- start:450 stop:641 length:192 start_codon:yes stop_codon:yes gene_type:complete